ncbi:ribosomal RNA small subunit methyltransferase I [Deltaproteobacteria bacterium]|nr:ribosomal RNA small subunit methyltransferase I [Deltaproteobacteria bacterium]
MPLTSPRLWVVATPLGNPGDLSPRARYVLETADVILAEDTRRAAQLCARHGIHARNFLSFYEHNEEQRAEEALRLLRAGRSLALISDGGTPLVADPGYRLVRACRKEGITVSPLPGPCAPVVALSAAGLPPLPFTFLGFLPRNAAGQKALFAAFAATPGALVFFERKDRLKVSLALALTVLGPREMAVCRELTKTHEEFILTRLEKSAELSDGLLGELTIVIGPPEQTERTSVEEVRLLVNLEAEPGDKPRALARRLQRLTCGWSRKELYSLILDNKN